MNIWATILATIVGALAATFGTLSTAYFNDRRKQRHDFNLQQLARLEAIGRHALDIMRGCDSLPMNPSDLAQETWDPSALLHHVNEMILISQLYHPVLTDSANHLGVALTDAWEAAIRRRALIKSGNKEALSQISAELAKLEREAYARTFDTTDEVLRAYHNCRRHCFDILRDCGKSARKYQA